MQRTEGVMQLRRRGDRERQRVVDPNTYNNIVVGLDEHFAAGESLIEEALVQETKFIASEASSQHKQELKNVASAH